MNKGSAQKFINEVEKQILYGDDHHFALILIHTLAEGGRLGWTDDNGGFFMFKHADDKWRIAIGMLPPADVEPLDWAVAILITLGNL